MPAIHRPFHRARAVMLGCLLGLLGLLGLGHAQAQWSEDPAVNLLITGAAGEQVLPIPAVTSDGGCYVGWFDQASGNYDVYLQRLDAQGNAQWAGGGIPVSTEPQSSSLVAWDLTVDADDNAVLVFSDTRAGSDLDIYAYKVSPGGDLLWGAGGVTLSTNNAFEPGAAVTVATDGDLVFAWAYLPDAGDGSIRLQRLAPDGTERYPHGGIDILTETGASPAFTDIIPSADGSVIVSCVRDISSYYSNRYFKAERFAADGSSVWGGAVYIYDAYPLPLGYHPRIQSDGDGGLVAAFHASEANYHQSRFQRIDAAGTEVHPHNGIRVTELAGRMHIDPSLAYQPDTGDAYVFWNERNSAQSQWGIYAQRVSSAGVLEWGVNGLELLPVNSAYKSFPRAVPCAGGAMVFLSDEPGGAYDEDRLIGMRLDGSGAQVWPGEIVEVATSPSSKSRYPATVTGDDMAILVWEDDRGGTADLYAQNVNADGTLGVSSAGAPVLVPQARALLLPNEPNPFAGLTRFRIPTTRGLAHPQLEILDLEGRRVNVFPVLAGARETQVVAWNGRSQAGRALPDGVYFYRLVHAAGASPAGRLTLVR